jgi:hypothetical protein
MSREGNAYSNPKSVVTLDGLHLPGGVHNYAVAEFALDIVYKTVHCRRVNAD